MPYIYWLPSIYLPIWLAHHIWPTSHPHLSSLPSSLHSDLTPCARPFSAWMLSYLAWVLKPQVTAPSQTYPLTPFDLWFHKTSHSLPYYSGLKSGPPKKNIYIWTLQISGYNILNKGLCKCNLGKDFKMRSLWMREGLKPQNEHLYKRQKQKWQRHTQERGPREDRGRGWMDGSTSQGMSGVCWEPAEAGRGIWHSFSLGASRKKPLCWYLDFDLPALQNCKRMHFWCFKPPHLWQFVKAAMVKLIQTLVPRVRTWM